MIYYRLTSIHSGDFVCIAKEDELYNMDPELFKAEIITTHEQECCKMLIQELSFWQRFKFLFRKS